MEDLSLLTVRERSARGVKWITIAEIGIRLLQVGISIVLARILGPSVFGIFGVCLILYKLISAIGDAGFGTLLIQRSRLTDRVVDNAFLISIVFSIILWLTLYLTAGYFERVFPYPELGGLLRAFSFIFIITGITILLRSILIRDLRLPAFAIIQFVSAAAGGGLSLILAVSSMGIWSLIFGLYLEAGLNVVLLAIFSQRKIRPSFKIVLEREDVRFALKAIFTRGVYFINSALGAVFIGKYLGDQALGFYVVAYGVVDLPVQRLSKNVGIMAVAALSRVQSDPREFGNLYKTIHRYFSLVVFALFIGLFVAAEEFVEGFYGQGWRGMTAPLQVLCLLGLLRSLLVVSSASLIALNKIGSELMISLFQGVMMAGFIMILYPHGLAAACLGMVLAHGAGYLYTLVVLASRLNLYWTKLLGPLYYAAVPAGGMILTWLIIRVVLKDHIPNLVLLFVHILTCGAVFVLIAHTMDKRFILQIKRFLFSKT